MKLNGDDPRLGGDDVAHPAPSPHGAGTAQGDGGVEGMASGETRVGDSAVAGEADEEARLLSSVNEALRRDRVEQGLVASLPALQRSNVTGAPFTGQTCRYVGRKEKAAAL